MCDVHGVHMIGSVALSDTESVFRTLVGELGPWLKRLPDGETGARGRWIFWQREMLIEHPDFELATDIPEMELLEWNGRLMRKAPYVRLKAGRADLCLFPRYPWGSLQGTFADQVSQ